MKVQLPSPTAFTGFTPASGKQNMLKKPQVSSKTNQSEKQLSREDFKLFIKSVQSKCAIKQPEEIIDGSTSNDEKLFPLKYHLRYSKIEEDNGEDQESGFTEINDKIDKRGSKMHTDQSDSRFNKDYISHPENYQGKAAFQLNHEGQKGLYPGGNQKKQLNNFVSPQNKIQVQSKETGGVQKFSSKTTPFTKPFRRKVSLPALLGCDTYSRGMNSPMKSQIEEVNGGEEAAIKSNQESNGTNNMVQRQKQEHQRTYSHAIIETPQNHRQQQQFMAQFSGMNSNKQMNKIGLLGSKSSNLLIGEVFNLDQKETKGLKEVLFKEVQGLKVQRNGYRQENNGLREKIVNMQKDIKIMNRQIERWSVESRLVFDEHEEPLIDAYSSEQVYDDPNFYLVSLQQRVKSMQKEENTLDDQIRLYQETMRVIRTDLKADERLVDLERELMVQYHLLLEGKGVQDKDEILEARDGLQEAIRKLRESNRTLVAEIRLQKETQFENDAEIMKMEKHIEQRQIKIIELREEVKNKSPEELQAQKKVAKEKTLKLEEEKKNAIEMQAMQLSNQAEQLHNLQFQFQEFRRDQILHSQQQLQVTQNFQSLLRRAKDIALRTRSSVQKKKKMIKAIKQKGKEGKQNQTSPMIEQFRQHLDNQESNPQSKPTSHNSSSIEFQQQVPPKRSLKENFQSPTHSLTETPYVSSKNSPIRKVDSSPSKQNNNLTIERKSSLHRFHDIHPLGSAEQSLCSTYRGAFGESEKSQYNNDKPISVISCSNLTADV